jgi:hypothetical protein
MPQSVAKPIGTVEKGLTPALTVSLGIEKWEKAGIRHFYRAGLLITVSRNASEKWDI